MYNDTLTDMVSRINVALLERDQNVSVPKSKLNILVLNQLYIKGCIGAFHINPMKVKVYLKYWNNKPVLQKLKCMSTPGRQFNWRFPYLRTELYKTNYMCFYILSTTMGVLCSDDLLLMGYEKRIGGRILLKVLL